MNYILDLKRVAADPEKLKNLGILVKSGNMPPNDSKSGPLSDEQKDTISRWLSAGAPVESSVRPAPAEDVPLQEGTSPETPEPGISPALRTLKWIGKFHLLFLHFPIALIFLAAAAEVWFWWFQDEMSDAMGVVRACVFFAALTGAVVAGLGWLHAFAGHGASQPDMLFWHRWVGTAAAVL